MAGTVRTFWFVRAAHAESDTEKALKFYVGLLLAIPVFVGAAFGLWRWAT